jgi:hypothetical protein
LAPMDAAFPWKAITHQHADSLLNSFNRLERDEGHFQ